MTYNIIVSKRRHCICLKFGCECWLGWSQAGPLKKFCTAKFKAESVCWCLITLCSCNGSDIPLEKHSTLKLLVAKCKLSPSYTGLKITSTWLQQYVRAHRLCHMHNKSAEIYYYSYPAPIFKHVKSMFRLTLLSSRLAWGAYQMPPMFLETSSWYLRSSQRLVLNTRRH